MSRSDVSYPTLPPGPLKPVPVPNYDKGVIKRGPIVMFRSVPGRYFTVHMREVSEAEAKAAGFPVEKYRVQETAA